MRIRAEEWEVQPGGPLSFSRQPDGIGRCVLIRLCRFLLPAAQKLTIDGKEDERGRREQASRGRRRAHAAITRPGPTQAVRRQSLKRSAASSRRRRAELRNRTRPGGCHASIGRGR